MGEGGGDGVKDLKTVCPAVTSPGQTENDLATTMEVEVQRLECI